MATRNNHWYSKNGAVVRTLLLPTMCGLGSSSHVQAIYLLNRLRVLLRDGANLCRNKTVIQAGIEIAMQGFVHPWKGVETILWPHEFKFVWETMLSSCSGFSVKQPSLGGLPVPV